MVNYIAYFLLTRVLGIDDLLANAIAWIVAVAFAYVTNRKWVFESRARGVRPVLKEVGEFVLGRLFTLGLEELLLWVFVVKLGANDLLIKIIASVVTVVLNYVFSKFIIFKKPKNKTEHNDASTVEKTKY